MSADQIVLDASFLIGALRPTDAHHAAAQMVLRRGAVAGALLAHPLTIAESAVGATRAGRGEQLRQAYEALRIVAVPPDAEAPWRLAHLRVITRLPMPDCCVMDAALQTGAALATFDEALGAAATVMGIELVAV